MERHGMARHITCRFEVIFVNLPSDRGSVVPSGLVTRLVVWLMALPVILMSLVTLMLKRPLEALSLEAHFDTAAVERGTSLLFLEPPTVTSSSFWSAASSSR